MIHYTQIILKSHGIQALMLTALILAGLLGCQTTSRRQKAVDSKKAVIVSYINSGALKTALRELDNLLRVAGQDADIHNLMGLTQLALENDGKALQYFNQSFKLKPSPAVKLNISSVHIQMGNATAAKKALLEIINWKGKKYQHLERVYHNLGLIYQKEKNYPNAIKSFRKAIVENPTYHMSWLEMGLSYDRLKKYKEASRALRKSVQFCGSCITTVEQLSNFYMRRGDHVEAMKILNKYVRNEKTKENHKQHALGLIERANKLYAR